MALPTRPLPSRRDLLRTGAGAALAGLFLPSLRSVWADEQPLVAPTVPGFGKAKQVVFLYMIGGPSHFETFDPKPGTSTGGPTRTVATSVNGIEIDVTAGYGPSGVDVPSPLRQAIMMLVAHWYEHRGAVGHDLATALTPQGFDALIAPYRVIRL